MIAITIGRVAKAKMENERRERSEEKAIGHHNWLSGEMLEWPARVE